MLKRLTQCAAALGLVSVTGCMLVDLLMLPFELLVSVLGLVGDGIGAIGGAVVTVDPLEGPVPQVAEREPGQWAIGGLSADSRFRIDVSAPGRVSRQYLWPDDFPDAGPPDAGTIRVTARLEVRPETPAAPVDVR